MQGIEDTSILEDVAEAEEGYDKPDQVQFPSVAQQFKLKWARVVAA